MRHYKYTKKRKKGEHFNYIDSQNLEMSFYTKLNH